MTAAIIDTSVHFKKPEYSNKLTSASTRRRIFVAETQHALVSSVAQSEFLSRERGGEEERAGERHESVRARVCSQNYINPLASHPRSVGRRWEKAVSITVNLSTD